MALNFSRRKPGGTMREKQIFFKCQLYLLFVGSKKFEIKQTE